MRLSYSEREVLRMLRQGARAEVRGARHHESLVVTGEGFGMTVGAGVGRNLVALGLLNPDLTLTKDGERFV